MTEVVAALIWDEDRFLICQRPEHKARGLMYLNKIKLLNMLREIAKLFSKNGLR